MKWLAKQISYDEMVFSQMAARHNIDNTPREEIKAHLARTALALQTIRAYFRRPLIISSGYRCCDLNRLVGGASESHHTLGFAADFVVKDVPIERVIEVIPQLIEFDQLINEYGRWIHLSIYPTLRRQIIKV